MAKKRTTKKQAAFDVAQITAIIREHRALGTDGIARELGLDQDGEDELAAFMIERQGPTTWLRGGDDRWYVQVRPDAKQTMIPGTEPTIPAAIRGQAEHYRNALESRLAAQASEREARQMLERAMDDAGIDDFYLDLDDGPLHVFFEAGPRKLKTRKESRPDDSE